MTKKAYYQIKLESKKKKCNHRIFSINSTLTIIDNYSGNTCSITYFCKVCKQSKTITGDILK